MRPSHNGKGCEDAYQFHNAIEVLPQMPIVSPFRDAWLANRGDSGDQCCHLRIVTYNLLADWYAGRTVEACRLSPAPSVEQSLRQTEVDPCKASKKAQSFYTYCDGSFLMRNRRFPMIMAEILAYQADIICLQEVDECIFGRLLMPVLKSKGYQGYYSSKEGAQSEGCAMFWSLQAFENADTVDMHTFTLCDLQEAKRGPIGWVHKPSEPSWEGCTASIQQLLENNPSLRDMMTSNKLGQVVQIALLHPRRSANTGPSKPKAILLANTHLFYHPMADHIRAIQAFSGVSIP